MRKPTGWLLSVAVIATTLGTSTAAAGTVSAAEADIADRLQGIPGMTLVEEKEASGDDRFFLLDYTQPVDHNAPDGATFEQRVSVLHTDEDGPTVYAPSGYNLNPNPAYSEPTQLIDGNEVGVEHRFFGTSVPSEDDWSTLDVWQAAQDHHRVYSALEGIYDGNWIATGRSKGGMTATYYRYFFPDDMDGIVAYVAPSNIDPADSTPYDELLARVGTEECRDHITGLEREVLLRRDEMIDLHQEWADELGATFETVGGLEQSFEVAPLNLSFTFWQYYSLSDCADIPALDAPSEELYDYLDAVVGFGADHELEFGGPYYYQAATELGSPYYSREYLGDLVQFPEMAETGAFVPPHVDVPEFDNSTIIDVDEWVRTEGTELLYVNGGEDPWSAKPFAPAGPQNDSHVLTVDWDNHGALIGGLGKDDRQIAIEALNRWAGLNEEVSSEDSAPSYDPALDHPTQYSLGS